MNEIALNLSARDQILYAVQVSRDQRFTDVFDWRVTTYVLGAKPILCIANGLFIHERQ